MHDLFSGLFEWYRQSLADGGYLLVGLLMAIESSIIPLPSEAIIPPAVIVARQTGNMTLGGIIIAGAIGSWVGATVMYWASRWAGRPLVLKYGKYFFVPPAKVELAETWSAQFGSFGVFASRLIPVVRHLIGIPAGIVRMSFWRYSLYTLIGSAIWSAVLTWVGVQAGKDEALMNGELHRLTIWLVGALAVLGTIYWFFVHRHLKAAKKG
jgi:membrane protein DedA with SNARE-associated domain